MTPEGRVVNQICAWLSWRKALFFIHSEVGIYNAQRGVYMRRSSPYKMRGVADILGIWAGVPLAIEVKSERGRASEYQLEFIKRWREAGGIGIIAKSIEDVERGINEYFERRALQRMHEAQRGADGAQTTGTSHDLGGALPKK